MFHVCANIYGEVLRLCVVQDVSIGGHGRRQILAKPKNARSKSRRRESPKIHTKTPNEVMTKPQNFRDIIIFGL